MTAAAFIAGCGAAEGDDTGDAGDFPEQEITFIVPYNAGSAPDSTSRKLSTIVEGDLGQSIVVVNKPGGGGTVGLQEIISAEPDGYTIGLSTMAALTIAPQRLDTTYEGPQDVQPIMQTGAVPSVLFVNADSDIQTPQDLIEQAKANPGEITLGNPGEHSVFDLQMELFQQQAGIELSQTYTGAGKQVTPVVNGTIDAGVSQPGVALQYVEKGDLRIVGYFGEQKPPGVDAPSFAEAGIDEPFLSYEGLVAPPGIPDERLKVIHDAYRAALESDEYTQWGEETGALVQYVSTEEFQQKLQDNFDANTGYIEQFGWAQS